MAQKTIVLLTDDLDGGEADETLTFSVDDKSYEIDLSHTNADKLRKALEPFIAAGRKTGRASAGTRSRATTPKNGGADPTAIRAWAKVHGYEVNDRGRVPAHIREAYEKANGCYRNRS
ncbi:Lsr2 family protein [Streptomyces leeuwenhoekii]|uniref:histone-like nucleoid-structuring protein Lsr2 n=1 Tax=Streptomyces leeuwenhoekii TaxID=1437453 RepID=UPI00367CC8F5